ncbi:MAG: hypothetical protein ONA90_05740, partial [candidate division KSB1 bacterium]|nr:hypothetical protein [candidate division KSB1 bacterium]
EFIGNSLMGAKLGGPLDMDFLFEFFKHKGEAIGAFNGLILVVPAAYWLFTLFLSGGALAVFASGGKYTPVLFWGSAAKYFGRFIRLALWCVPAFAMLFSIQFVETGIQRLIFGSDPYQNIIYWGGWIKLGLRSLGILLFGLILDYARIHAVLTEERRMRFSVWQSIRFAFGNFLQTFGLALLLLMIGAVALLIYNPIADSLSAPNAVIVFMLFLLQQAYMIFRTTLRLTLYSSQLHLYRQLSAEVAPVASGGLTIEGLAPAME